MSDITLNNLFGEEMQKYKPKFELGKVYSDPRVNAFTKQPIEEPKLIQPNLNNNTEAENNNV